MTNPTTTAPVTQTPDEFLARWLGHRRLTRRVIEAFPEDALFAFTPAPPMRPFGDMAWEIHGVTGYTLSGLVTDAWGEPRWEGFERDKGALLAAWDALTECLAAELPTVPPARYAEVKTLAWGSMTALEAATGVLENETHHRGQGYVYLRALGIAPPQFWER